MSNISKLVLFASSNNKGKTKELINKLFPKGARIINLDDYNLSFFKYEQDYPDSDRFDDLYKLILKHDHIVIASPIYWSSVCSQMKVFIDRLSDLLIGSKKRLLDLRKKSFSFVTTFGTDEPLGCVGVEEQIIGSLAYLKVRYIHGLIYYTGDNENLMALNDKNTNSYMNAINSLKKDSDG